MYGLPTIFGKTLWLDRLSLVSGIARERMKNKNRWIKFLSLTANGLTYETRIVFFPSEQVPSKLYIRRWPSKGTATLLLAEKSGPQLN